jgi:hypothetical protein
MNPPPTPPPSPTFSMPVSPSAASKPLNVAAQSAPPKPESNPPPKAPLKMAPPPSRWNMPPAVYQSLVGRLGMLLLLSGSVGLLWWSVHRLQPVSAELQRQTTEISRLTDEIQQLELGWDAREAEQAEARFQELQDQLFANPEECMVWQAEMESAQPLPDLQVKASHGEKQPVKSPFLDKNVAALPVTFEVQPLAEADAPYSSYRRMLEFTRRLMEQQKRIDLLELSVHGRSNSVSHARIELQLWTREVEPGGNGAQGETE